VLEKGVGAALVVYQGGMSMFGKNNPENDTTAKKLLEEAFDKAALKGCHPSEVARAMLDVVVFSALGFGYSEEDVIAEVRKMAREAREFDGPIEVGPQLGKGLPD
jgi:hypothetical protein